MRSVVEGEKIFAQVYHGIEDRTVAFKVENPFAIGEHAAFEEALHEIFRFMDHRGFVWASESAGSTVVAVVVDEPVFLSDLF